MSDFESRRRPSSISTDENPYWISFSDIMAGLLVIFILAAVMLNVELTQRKENVDNAIQEIKMTNGLREVMLEEIVEELSKRGIRVEISEDKKVLRIPEDVLAFETRQYQIPRDRLDIVADIGRVIHDRITTESRFKYIDTIFVEGHTDSRPARGFMQDQGNWGLSTARATSIWRYWSSGLDYSEQISALRNERNEPMFSVSGYAATRPLEPDDDTPE